MLSTTLVLLLTIGVLTVFTALGIIYSRSRVHTVEDLISARNTTGRGATTATLIASMMGAWILFSPAEAGAAFGGIAAITGYAVGSAVPLLLFIAIGTRVRYLIPNGHTLTEYVYVRYGRLMYTYVLIVTVFYMFIFLAAEMTGIAGALGLIAGVPAWQTALLIGGFVIVYTTYGGLVASIFTDTIQTLVILPVLVLTFVGAILALGGTESIYLTITTTQPELLDPGYRVGLEFGAFVMIAILAANMFNQGLWQRIFAAENSETVRRSFGIAAIAMIPMILLPGLFGITAAGMGLVNSQGDASIAFFLVLTEAFPAVVVLGITLLVLLLVMSTADTLFSAIASIVAADLPLVLDNPSERMLMWSARTLTVLVGLAAIFVGSRGYSVLELFLLADLLAAATVFPFLYGLYSSRANQSAVLISSFVSLAFGLLHFPITNALLIEIPGIGLVTPSEPSFLFAFAGTAALSILLTISLSRLSTSHFDFTLLAREIRSLDRPKETDSHIIVNRGDEQ